MVSSREPLRRGKMTERFAEEYSEYAGYYIEPRGTCENPSCGKHPITHRHILRNPVSGDVKEIGSHCYQRWRQLQGMVVDPWFWQYLDVLRVQALSSPGTVIVPKEQRKIYEEQRKKWLIKDYKKKNIRLERVDFRASKFRTEEEAKEYAEKHGGYLGGDITIRGKRYWSIYLPETSKAVTVLYFICPQCGREHSIDEFNRSKFCRKCGKLLTLKNKHKRGRA